MNHLKDLELVVRSFLGVSIATAVINVAARVAFPNLAQSTSNAILFLSLFGASLVAGRSLMNGLHWRRRLVLLLVPVLISVAVVFVGFFEPRATIAERLWFALESRLGAVALGGGLACGALMVWRQTRRVVRVA